MADSQEREKRSQAPVYRSQVQEREGEGGGRESDEQPKKGGRGLWFLLLLLLLLLLSSVQSLQEGSERVW